MYRFLFLLVLNMLSSMNQLLANDKSVKVPEPDAQFFIAQIRQSVQTALAGSEIPVSIALGQACLESGFGTSRLAKHANNFLGIKCGKDWKGEVYRKFDDCGDTACHFRKYQSVEHCFTDYREFLQKTRYKFIHSLKRNDYRSWAIGLQIAGYSPDCEYAYKLIGIIEKYGLDQYDLPIYSLAPKKNQYALCVLADAGHKLQEVAKQFEIPTAQLAEYNEVAIDYECQQQEIIWLCPKSTLPLSCEDEIEVGQETNLHQISQTLCIKVSVLEKLNPGLNRYTTLRIGQTILIRPRK